MKKGKGIINYLHNSSLSRVNMFVVFILGIVVAIVWFFLITSFFQGWENAKFFDDIPDLFVFVVAFGIVFYSLKIKDSFKRKMFFIGGLLICIRRLSDVLLQEYQEVVGQLLPFYYWSPVLIMEFSGFLLLLIGLSRRFRKK